MHEPAAINLLSFLGVDAPGKNLSRPQRRCVVERPGILVKGKPSAKEPAKINFNAWRAAQRARLDRVPISAFAQN
jgi:hypothetical protein